ncbi:MAG: tryptophan--tRNA ligase [Anaerolineae bacterium]
MSEKGRILTGHRPTGRRHLGHLVGTLENWAGLQDDYECLFLIADLHVLTTDCTHPEHIQSNIAEVVMDWLAAGLDPERSTFVLQSAVKEHAELALLFSMLVTVGCLERNPTYKEQVKELGLNPSLGLLAYPVLQAADILVYKADTVPVGEDQMPHIEIAREVARRFNATYGETFPEPQGLLSHAPRLPGTDNRTMHTSYGNAIYLSDDPGTVGEKVMMMYTDPTRIHTTDPGHVEGNPVFAYHGIFNEDREEVEELKARYRAGRVGDIEVKRRLAKALNRYLTPLREKRREFAARPDYGRDVLHEGTARARLLAQATMAEVREKMGLT